MQCDRRLLPAGRQLLLLLLLLSSGGRHGRHLKGIFDRRLVIQFHLFGQWFPIVHVSVRRQAVWLLLLLL